MYIFDPVYGNDVHVDFQIMFQIIALSFNQSRLPFFKQRSSKNDCFFAAIAAS